MRVSSSAIFQVSFKGSHVIFRFSISEAAFRVLFFMFFVFHPKRSRHDQIIIEVLVFKRLNDRLEWLGDRWTCGRRLLEGVEDDDDDDDDDLFLIYTVLMRFGDDGDGDYNVGDGNAMLVMMMMMRRRRLLQHTLLPGRHTFWAAATFAFCYVDISLMTCISVFSFSYIII